MADGPRSDPGDLGGDCAAINKLEAARQALREQVAAREHAEQLLQEAQVTIRDLQTKLAHERLAGDEAVRRVESELQTLRQALQTIDNELATQRVALLRAERDRDQANAGRRRALERTRGMAAVQEAEPVSTVSSATRSGRRAMKSGITGGPAANDALANESYKNSWTIPPMTLPATAANPGTLAAKNARGRGRPPKPAKLKGEFVEWWKPGWREKFR